MSSGIIMDVWRLRDILWNVFSSLIVASTSHAKVPSKALDWTLSNYWEQNKIASSEIFQKHRHLKLPLEIYTTSARHNFEINLHIMSLICSTETLIFMHGAQKTDNDDN